MAKPQSTTIKSLAWGEVSDQRLKENIALLHLANAEPMKPRVNAATDAIQNRKYSFQRQLTFELEGELTSTLAFIGATTDDPEQVLAVCIEESPAGNSIIFRIAANDGDVKARKKALQKMLSPLEQIARGEAENNNERTLFHNLISANKKRLLTRLGSKHAPPSHRNPGQKALVSRIADTLARVKSHGHQTSTDELRRAEVYIKNLQSLMSQLEKLKKEQVASLDCHLLLGDIIKKTCALSHHNRLGRLMDSVPGNDINPNLRQGLPRSVGKVGRYHSSCKFLASTAKTIQLFRRIVIQGVRLLPGPRDLPVANQSDTTLAATVARILNAKAGTVKKSSWDIVILNQAVKNPFAKSTFQASLKTPVRNLKIHAEIQLLFFYESDKTKCPPRIICSNKSACFLCDLFFQSHGRFHVKRTHGVLYKNWTLPDLKSLSLDKEARNRIATAAEVFNERLEDRIRTELRTKQPILVRPNESCFSVIGSWVTSSTSSLPLHMPPPKEALYGEQKNGQDVSQPATQDDSGPSAPSALMSQSFNQNTRAGQEVSVQAQAANDPIKPPPRLAMSNKDDGIVHSPAAVPSVTVLNHHNVPKVKYTSPNSHPSSIKNSSKSINVERPICGPDRPARSSPSNMTSSTLDLLRLDEGDSFDYDLPTEPSSLKASVPLMDLFLSHITTQHREPKPHESEPGLERAPAKSRHPRDVDPYLVSLRRLNPDELSQLEQAREVQLIDVHDLPEGQDIDIHVDSKVESESSLGFTFCLRYFDSAVLVRFDRRDLSRPIA